MRDSPSKLSNRPFRNELRICKSAFRQRLLPIFRFRLRLFCLLFSFSIFCILTCAREIGVEAMIPAVAVFYEAPGFVILILAIDKVAAST